MELKDMILSTLAELEEQPKKEEVEKKEPPKADIEEIEQTSKEPISGTLKPLSEIEEKEEVKQEDTESKSISDERVFCESVRERILVLFEGFQSPNNKNIEAKIDLTLNFLEYLLAVIDERLEHLDSK